MGYDIDAIRDQLRTDGYAVLPDLLGEDEIARLREIVGGFFGSGRGVVFNLGKTQPNAAIEVPELGFLFADPKIAGFYKELYGADGTLFTGHCDIHDSIVSNWHRDTGGPGHPYFDEPCFTDECRVYKMAFYLQDHMDGQGLTVVPGSHREDGNSGGKPVSIQSKAGDAVVFDVRINHRGREPSGLETVIQRGARFGARTLAKLGLRDASEGQPRWTSGARELLDRATGTGSRMSVFFTFGADNRFSHQFARTNMDRQLSQYADCGHGYPDGLASALAEQGIAVYRPGTDRAGSSSIAA